MWNTFHKTFQGYYLSRIYLVCARIDSGFLVYSSKPPLQLVLFHTTFQNYIFWFWLPCIYHCILSISSTLYKTHYFSLTRLWIFSAISFSAQYVAILRFRIELYFLGLSFYYLFVYYFDFDNFCLYYMALFLSILFFHIVRNWCIVFFEPVDTFYDILTILSTWSKGYRLMEHRHSWSWMEYNTLAYLIWQFVCLHPDCQLLPLRCWAERNMILTIKRWKLNVKNISLVNILSKEFSQILMFYSIQYQGLQII